MPTISPKQYDNHCITGMPCQQELTPIIPVRFSLTAKALEKAQTGEIPASPKDTKIGTADYELRRLRHGYLYIYSELGMANNSTDGSETKEGHWLIFEHFISNESIEVENRDKKSAGLPYHFRKYTWKNGIPQSEWILEPKSYSYAFVHKQVTLINIAYSEQRWPVKFFELLESNKTARDTLMQSVSLANDNSEVTLHFDNLAKVADFNPEQSEQDKQDSLTRATAIGFNPEHKITILKEDEKARAKIVAIHDPIANLADISSLHEHTWINLINARKKYLYPTSTAKAVMGFKPHLRDLWFKSFPYKKQNEAILEEYAANDFYDKIEELKQLNDAIQHLVKVQHAMMEQDGIYSLQNRLKYMTEDTVKLITDDENELFELNEINMQASEMVKLAMQGIGLSDQGMKQQSEMLASDSAYGGYIGKILATAQRVEVTYRNKKKSDGLKEIKRLKLELMCESIMTAQFYRWSHQDLKEKSITRETYLKAFGLTRTTVSITDKADKAFALFEQQIKGFLQDKVRIQPAPVGTTRHASSGTIQSTTQSLRFDMIVAAEQNNAQDAQNKLNMSHKIGIFLAGLALLDTYKSLKESQNNPWWDSMAQRTYALTSLFAMFYHEKKWN